MRFSKPMDDVVYVRVSLDEKRALAEAARKCGLTLSELIRQGAEVIRTAAA